jgi:hypothetical protein
MAEHRSADDQLMISPGVIGTDCIDARARWLQGASEIGHRKGRHFVLHTKLYGRCEKRIDRLTHLRQQGFPCPPISAE